MELSSRHVFFPLFSHNFLQDETKKKADQHTGLAPPSRETTRTFGKKQGPQQTSGENHSDGSFTPEFLVQSEHESQIRGDLCAAKPTVPPVSADHTALPSGLQMKQWPFSRLSFLSPIIEGNMSWPTSLPQKIDWKKLGVLGLYCIRQSSRGITTFASTQPCESPSSVR